MFQQRKVYSQRLLHKSTKMYFSMVTPSRDRKNPGPKRCFAKWAAHCKRIRSSENELGTATNLTASSRYVTAATVYFCMGRGERCDGSESSASPADKPGRDGLDTRPEGKEVVEMKGEGRGPRRHICRHYSPEACRAWEPYLSPPQNSLLPTRPLPFYQRGPSTGLVPPLFGLDGLFSHLFFPHLYHLDSCSRICVFSFLSFFFVVCCDVASPCL